VKSYQSIDIWAMMLVTPAISETSDSPPIAVEQLLHKYHDVFADPKTLHLARIYDHTIPLIPGVFQLMPNLIDILLHIKMRLRGW
jgi:hypothetical protein